MKKLLCLTPCLTMAVALLLVAAFPASAGIIVTEGLPSPDTAGNASSGRLLSKHKSFVRLPGTRPGSPNSGDTVAASDDDDDDSDCVPGCLDELGGLQDLDEEAPEGWTCRQVGGGLEYCEPTEDGEASAMADEALQGCNAGEGRTSGGLALLLAACLLLLGLRRR